MAVAETIVPYAGELATAIVTALVGLGVWYNRQRRDNSKTDLQKAQDSTAGHFVKNLLDDHQRVVTQLKEAESTRATNAERIGALTSEVNHLREQVSDVKTLLREDAARLDKAQDEIHTLQTEINRKDGEIIRVTAAKEVAVQRAAEAEEKLAIFRASAPN